MEARILFLKGGSGSGNHGHRGRPGQIGGSARTAASRAPGAAEAIPKLPSSAHIQTLAEARAYWREHFGGKVMSLVVHSGGKQYPIITRFSAQATHAFTRKAEYGDQIVSYDDPVRKRLPRAFAPERAKLMDKILRTIEHPQVHFSHYGADLLCERNIGSQRFVVVLTWNSMLKIYEFNSTYSMTEEQFQKKFAARDRHKNSGPLQKSEPLLSAPSAFRGLYGPGSYPAGGQPEESLKPHSGFCRDRSNSIIPILFLRKRSQQERRSAPEE